MKPSMRRSFVGLVALLLCSSIAWSWADERLERAEALRREAQELAREGEKKKAAALREEANELDARAKQEWAEHMAREDRRVREEAERNEQIERLRKEADELAAAGKLERAEQVERRIRDLRRENLHPNENLEAELRELHSALHHFEQKQKELAEQGHDKGVQALNREIRNVRDQIALREHVLSHSDKHPDQRHPYEGELAERIEHLHVAAEHLQAAGAQEFAHAVRQRAEEWEHEFHQRHDEHAYDAHDELHHDVHALHEAIHDLRHEVERLRDELAEVRDAVNRD